MNNTNTINHIYSLLKGDKNYLDNEGDLLVDEVRRLANKYDESLLTLLHSDDKARDTFFLKVGNTTVFKQNDFDFFLEEKLIDNSYTAYKNRIGLASGNRMLKDVNDVVLNFPYKDCILEGGQSTEEGLDTYVEYSDKTEEYEEKTAKRKEIFFNQVLAKDEIDRLTEPKAFENIKRYTKDGEEEVTQFNRNDEGVITDNLIIKGNNLLALHSLLPEFEGKVKLIYIDPPYNTGSDSFAYNDNFNHSSWLVFMKNRLEQAKKLLADDGAIFVHVDHHEISYINILLDEIFGKGNKVQVIAIKTASPAGFKTVNPGPIDVTEYMLFYTKHKPSYKFTKGYVPVGYNSNYNLYLERSENVKDWKFTPIKEKVIKVLGFESEKDAKAKYGDLWGSIYKASLEDFAYKNAENIVSVRDPHKPTETVKRLMQNSKQVDYVLEYERENGTIMYLYKGGALAFYSNKMQSLDGVMVITELLTDFWNHISWAGIANEGGVKLKNGKKPEKLIKQILDIATNENDIILDYHLGSGTTCAVAHKMGRQYIGIEQMNYDDNDSIVRLNNVIQGDQTGISKAADWKGGGSFVYMELAKNNQKAIEHIEKCKSYDELVPFFDEMCDTYFLDYNLKIREFKEIVSKEENFKALSLDQLKKIFAKMLDLNQLYVNVSDMEDAKFKLSDKDIQATKDFYKK